VKMTNNKDSLQNKAPLRERQTLTIRDTSATCKHCDLPIKWTRTRSGKFAPIESANGRDHRETCTGLSPATRISVRDKNHAARVKGFFNSVGAL
jgi:hypothetical protein